MSDYNKDPLCHAYYFMETLLLGEMLRDEGRRNLPLDITQPRPATEPMALVRRLAVSVEAEARITMLHRSLKTMRFYALYQVRARSGSQTPAHRVALSPSDAPQYQLSSVEAVALAGAPQTGVQPEIVQPERKPFFLTPDRADMEQANYVASQETPETKEQLGGVQLMVWTYPLSCPGVRCCERYPTVHAARGAMVTVFTE